jgi:ATP-dependent DNA ligase
MPHRPQPSDNTIFGIPRLAPMLASTAKEPFDDKTWVFEPKWDGYRCLAYLSSSSSYLDSRNMKSLIPKFPSFSNIHRGLLASRALLDGEVIALRDGRVDFSYLRKEPSSVTFVVFDILWLNDTDMTKEPLEVRLKALDGVYRYGQNVVRSERVAGLGTALFDWVRDNDMEGIVGKKLGTRYLPGERVEYWVKVRNKKEGVFWVLGYFPTAGSEIGSLLLGSRGDKGFQVVGRVSSGLSQQYEERLRRCLIPSISPSKLIGKMSKRELREITWVKPFYGVEVTYTEITPDGKIRHPVFKEVAKS